MGPSERRWDGVSNNTTNAAKGTDFISVPTVPAARLAFGHGKAAGSEVNA